jgi:hypothetical protein
MASWMSNRCATRDDPGPQALQLPPLVANCREKCASSAKLPDGALRSSAQRKLKAEETALDGNSLSTLSFLSSWHQLIHARSG